MESVLLLTIKVNLKNDIQIEAEDNFTVATIKEICHSYTDIAPESQKIVYKGKVLKDHETLQQCGVASGETLFLVTVKSEGPAPATDLTGVSDLNMQTGAGELAGMMRGLEQFGMMSRAQNLMDSLPDSSEGSGSLPPGVNMQQLSSMLRNPMFMNMLEGMLNDPNTFQSMINADPRMQQMFQRNPELREAMNTPQVRQQLIQNLQRMRNSSGTGPMMGAPGSLPAPGQVEQPASTIQPPTTQSTVPETPPQPNTGFQQPFFNPFAQGMPGAMPWLAGNQPNMTPQQPPEQQYASQLQQLRDMGFTNDTTNIQVLQATGGNVEAAIERLFNMIGNS